MKKKYVWWENLDGVICCPSCGRRIDNLSVDNWLKDDLEPFEPDFCPYCGQALDWSERRSYGVKEEHDAETVSEKGREVADSGILQKAIETYGEESQTKMVLEEMSELQKEICKRWRGADNRDAIADEVADVEIMLRQLKIMLDLDHSVQQHKRAKLIRLQERLEGSK